MGKYDLLFRHLATCGDGPVEMPFDEIGQVVGSLPASATRYAAWWSNEAADTTDVQAAAWMNAGREVGSVDRPGPCSLQRRTLASKLVEPSQDSLATDRLSTLKSRSAPAAFVHTMSPLRPAGQKW